MWIKTSRHVCVFYLWVLRLVPQSRDNLQCRLLRNSKLAIGLSVNGCRSVQDAPPRRDWLPQRRSRVTGNGWMDDQGASTVQGVGACTLPWSCTWCCSPTAGCAPSPACPCTAAASAPGYRWTSRAAEKDKAKPEGEEKNKIQDGGRRTERGRDTGMRDIGGGNDEQL